MLAMSLGLQSILLAPAARAARVMLREYAHDTEILQDEIRDLLAEARRKNPLWFSEFVRVGQKLNPRLLRVILPQ
jgi:hypothetical protein